jgi:hypothetical protein
MPDEEIVADLMEHLEALAKKEKGLRNTEKMPPQIKPAPPLSEQRDLFGERTLRGCLWNIPCTTGTGRYDRRDPWYVKHDAMKIATRFEADLLAGLKMIRDSDVPVDVKSLCNELIELVDTGWEDDQS